MIDILSPGKKLCTDHAHAPIVQVATAFVMSEKTKFTAWLALMALLRVMTLEASTFLAVDIITIRIHMVVTTETIH